MNTSCFLFLFASAWATAAGQTLEVRIANVQGKEGILMIGLFRTPESFLKEPWKGEKVKIKEGTMVVTIQNIPPGEYAISVFHDANENGKLDTNFIGIPKEGVGFSNDAMGMFGPPSFEKAMFKFPAQQTVSLAIKYF